MRMDATGFSELKDSIKGVKALNKEKPEGRAGTPWRDHFNVLPVWSMLYKPSLMKHTDDLQRRVLHGTVAVNAFVSASVSDDCPFCPWV